ncbi:MAG: deoxynucleoside kinase [Bacteroidia bacterium]|nr:deoxynucleoside kinase [Bacteroidia bacterium]MCZ2277749.1 deoxynucleoside kinase [Bacteroidia bacterium]
MSLKAGNYIVIEGNIGAGKTTLAEMLALKFNTSLILESFSENTFLAQFYNDPSRFAFPLEMSFLAERYRQLSHTFNKKDKREIIVSDYYFRKCLLFSQINLSSQEFRLFREFYELLEAQLPKPDLIVFLKKDVPILKKNIEKRGRSFENRISNEYLEQLNTAYVVLLNDLQHCGIPSLTIESNHLDFKHDILAFTQVVNQIMASVDIVNNSVSSQ